MSSEGDDRVTVKLSTAAAASHRTASLLYQQRIPAELARRIHEARAATDRHRLICAKCKRVMDEFARSYAAGTLTEPPDVRRLCVQGYDLYNKLGQLSTQVCDPVTGIQQPGAVTES